MSARMSTPILASSDRLSLCIALDPGRYLQIITCCLLLICLGNVFMIPRRINQQQPNITSHSRDPPSLRSMHVLFQHVDIAIVRANYALQQLSFLRPHLIDEDVI
jgi:hypothetical protein